jgi:transposase
LFGYHVFAWTVQLVWHLIQDVFGIKYHQRYIYSLLGRIGFKIAKPYPIHIKQDEKDVEKFYSQVLPALQKKNKNLKIRA